MHVVPASMHHGKFLSVVIDLRDGRGVWKIGELLHGKSVHVGTHHDEGSVAILHDGHHARSSDTLGNLETRVAELLGESRRGLDLDERQLGVRVKVLEERVEVSIVVRLDRRLELVVGSRFHRQCHESRNGYACC